MDTSVGEAPVASPAQNVAERNQANLVAWLNQQPLRRPLSLK